MKSPTAAKTKKAVDHLLKGEWAKRTVAFHFAASFDLQTTKLDADPRAHRTAGQTRGALLQVHYLCAGWGAYGAGRLGGGWSAPRMLSSTVCPC
jgi:hypothetical protein